MISEIKAALHEIYPSPQTKRTDDRGTQVTA